MIVSATVVTVGAAQAVIVGTVAADADAAIGAVVGGIFLIVNSILTIWLTRRIDHDEREQKEGRVDTEAEDSDSPSSNRPRRHRRTGV